MTFQQAIYALPSMVWFVIDEAQELTNFLLAGRIKIWT